MPKESEVTVLLALLPAGGVLVAQFDAHPFGAILLCSTVVLVVGIRALAGRAKRR